MEFLATVDIVVIVDSLLLLSRFIFYDASAAMYNSISDSSKKKALKSSTSFYDNLKKLCVESDVSSTLCDFQIFRDFVVVVDFLSIHSTARYDRKATVYCNSLTNSNQFSIQRCAVVGQALSLLG